jgi:hypothetical protein
MISFLRRRNLMRALLLLLMSFTIVLSGCASNVKTPNGASQWDFDHQVQFKQTDLEDGRYHLQVITQNDI